MTRIPQLEQELTTAAGRRYGAGRRARPRRQWLRLLVPVTAAALVLAVAATALRAPDPEVEAPAGKASPPPVTTLQDALGVPLGAAGTTPIDPSVEPVSLRVEDDAGAAWLVAAYGTAGAEAGAQACSVASPVDRAGTDGAGGCSEVGQLHASVAARDPQWHRAAIPTSRVAYGFVGDDAEKVEVTLGGKTRRAELGDRVFDARLFAVAFTAPEVPMDPNATPARLRVTYAGGERVDSLLPRDAPAASPPGCYREADVDSDTAVPAGEGTPVEICDRFWRETGFRGTPRPERLTACQGMGTAAWVFPGGPDVCARLGLEPYRE